jgi:hypothetical protein
MQLFINKHPTPTNPKIPPLTITKSVHLRKSEIKLFVNLNHYIEKLK